MDERIIDILSRLEEKVDKGFKSLNERIDRLESKVDRLETQVDENTRILRALEHSAQVSKAEQDKMAMNIAYIKGDVSAIKKDLLQVEEVTASNWSDIIKIKKSISQ